MEPATVIAFLERFGILEGSLMLVTWYAIRELYRYQRNRLAESEANRRNLQRELNRTRNQLRQLRQRQIQKDRPAKKRFWRR